MHDVAAAHLLNHPRGVPGLVESLGCIFHSDPSLRDGLASATVSRVDGVFLTAVGADGEFGALTAGPTRPIPSSATTTAAGGGGEDADLLLLLLDGRFRVGE
eukprot:4521498-Prymnesium_polylepis.1